MRTLQYDLESFGPIISLAELHHTHNVLILLRRAFSDSNTLSLLLSASISASSSNQHADGLEATKNQKTCCNCRASARTACWRRFDPVLPRRPSHSGLTGSSKKLERVSNSRKTTSQVDALVGSFAATRLLHVRLRPFNTHTLLTSPKSSVVGINSTMFISPSAVRPATRKKSGFLM